MKTLPARRLAASLARRLLLWGCLAALVVAPWWATPAAAAPTVAVEPARGPCDGAFVVRGRGFTPGEEVMVYVRPAYVPRTSPPGGFPARADTAGALAAAIPRDFVSCLPSRAPGGEQAHEVTAVAPSGNATAAFATSPSPRHCFPETGFCVAGRFLAYWQANGGLAINGYPLSDVFVQRLEDGREYAVQYFERVRLEAHEENANPYDVLVGQFGRRIYAATRGREVDPPASPMPGQRYFPETGQSMGGPFLAYWEANGGLAQFGYPISGLTVEVLEDGKGYTVQYFERARFEHHPEYANTPHEVLLGQFGRRILAEMTR